MHSFLFPEDLNGPTALSSQRRSAPSIHATKPVSKTRIPPQMPTRAPPTIPQHNLSAPPPPAYAPPPIPVMKENPTISITELNVSTPKQEPGLQRTKSKWSHRQMTSLASLKERREARAVARAAEDAAVIDVVLPPLSPIVDEEFWRTGRYPSSPRGFDLVHVPF